MSVEFRELEKGEDPYAVGIDLRLTSHQCCEHTKAASKLKWGKKTPQRNKRTL